jgi:GTPase SAR1 family protein
MRDLYIKNGQGFIIVYSLTSRQSFQDIKLIREQIIRVKGTEMVPIVLAANKCDVSDNQREVATIEGFQLANEWSIPYIETTAKNSHIVNSLFTEIVKEMNVKSNLFNGNKYKKKKKKSKKDKKLSSHKLVSNNSSNNNLIINSSSSSNNTKTNTISDHMSSLSNNSSSSNGKFNNNKHIGGSSGVLLSNDSRSTSCCLFSCIKRNNLPEIKHQKSNSSTNTINNSYNSSDLSHHDSNFIHKELKCKTNKQYCSIL